MITRNLLTRSYKLLLTLLVLLMSTNAFAQRLTATGKVVDAAGLEVMNEQAGENSVNRPVMAHYDLSRNTLRFSETVLLPIWMGSFP